MSQKEKEPVTDQLATDDERAEGGEIVCGSLRSRLAVCLTAVALLAVGGGVLAYLLLTAKRVDGEPKRDPGRLVRVLRARSGSHRCSVTVYGTARASQEWTAIAEVRGKAVQVNARFEPGEVLKADTLLIEIDTEELTLAVERFDAEVRAQLKLVEELDKTEANLKEILQLQDEQLELAVKMLKRLQSLAESDVATEYEVEAAQGARLAQSIGRQETSNALALIPLKRNRAQAAMDALEAQLKEAQRKLAACEIRLPYDARCVSKSIEIDQFVSPGERLGLFLAMDTAEVVAMVETRKGAALFPRGIRDPESLEGDPAVLGEGPPLQEMFRRVSAEIHWGSGEPWEGKVTRIASSLDRDTRTVPVIIEVANPYSDLSPGARPPLMPDAFCEITLHGGTVDEVVVIPRDCLHEIVPNGRPDRALSVVYLLAGTDQSDPPEADSELFGHLEIRRVSVLVLEDEVAVIEEGIEDGELLVLGDLFPASDGMLLRGLREHDREAPQ